MNVLSLFDGISCGRVALERGGHQVDKYFASEVKKSAIAVSQDNYPDIIRLGDVRNIKAKDLPKIDLLIGGSPCQDLSQANLERLGLAGSKSSLFWEYHRLWQELQPEFFLLENVDMPTDDRGAISTAMGCSGININSRLVSAQMRERVYWTNIPGEIKTLWGTEIHQPEDKKISLQSILENGYSDADKAFCIKARGGTCGRRDMKKLRRRLEKIGMDNIVFLSPDRDWDKGVRCFTQTELERLQTLPEGYTKILNLAKAWNCIGDGWTIDIIVHIFKGLAEDKKYV